ncbi:MAG TPA: carboxypeptidase-like regulatory domain-containing protein [Bryobacteraceae bacterium]|nr:carboxypeptidase-like regulatory domain-containing protein [Bryobacteraceae bacterium]
MPIALFAQDASLTLAGTVTNAATGEPVPRALVTIDGNHSGVASPNSPDAQPKFERIHRSALTDAGGNFRFSALPSANFFTSAQKPGFRYLPPQGTRGGAVNLQSSEENLRLQLAPLGAITGKILDQFDEPMMGVEVALLNQTIEDGVRHTRQIFKTATDDCGLYRIADVQPGKYYVKVLGQAGAVLVSTGARSDIGDSFRPGYQNGPAIDTATPIEIGAATPATADFHLTLEPAWRIRGNLRGFVPGSNIVWSIVDSGEEVAVSPDLFNPETGAFEIRDVVNGSYMISATQGNRRGEVAITVKDGDAGPVSLTLDPPATIPVNIRFSNTGPQQDLFGSKFPPFDNAGPCRVIMIPETRNGSGLVIRSFDITNGQQDLVAGTYRVEFRCYGVWIQSAVAGAQDLLSNPIVHVSPGITPPSIDVLAAWGGGKLQCRLEQESTHDEVHLLLIPQPLRSVSQVEFYADGCDGSYPFSDLAPGAYLVYAFDHEVEYRNPDFLQKLTGGQQVQIELDKDQEITIHEVIH